MMPDAWNRRVARLKSRYERGDELELERLIGEAVLAEREACAQIADEHATHHANHGRMTDASLVNVVSDAIRSRKP